MGKGTPLSNLEKDQITPFKEQGHSHRQISKQIKRFNIAIDIFLNQGNAYVYKIQETYMKKNDWGKMMLCIVFHEDVFPYDNC